MKELLNGEEVLGYLEWGKLSRLFKSEHALKWKCDV